MGDGGGTDDCPGHAGLHHGDEVGDGLDTAPQLHLQARLLDDLIDEGEILPGAVPGTVQVHHVDPGGAGVGKAAGGLQGAVGHLVDRVKIPFFQTDTAAVFHVDGRQQDHRFSPPKFFRICNPTSPLFSGWNWQPYTFPRPTAAVTGTP